MRGESVTDDTFYPSLFLFSFCFGSFPRYGQWLLGNDINVLHTLVGDWLLELAIADPMIFSSCLACFLGFHPSLQEREYLGTCLQET